MAGVPRDYTIDVHAARQRFMRAARSPADDVLSREIGRRMADRLSLIRYEPSRILDAGSGRGADIPALRARYAGAEVVAADFVPAFLSGLQPDRTMLGRLRSIVGNPRTHAVAARIDRLPLAGGAFGCVWSNLALPWVPDLPALFAEWARVLEPGGLVMFSTFGPDTLRELRAAFLDAGAGARVHAFVDMHDLGDMLVAAGFAQPVMDVERLTLTYPSVEDLLNELRATGQTSVRADRPRTLTGRRIFDQVRRAYPAPGLPEAQGRIAASVEVIYGHAWRAAPRRTAEGHAIVRFAGAAATKRSSER